MSWEGQNRPEVNTNPNVCKNCETNTATALATNRNTRSEMPICNDCAKEFLSNPELNRHWWVENFNNRLAQTKNTKPNNYPKETDPQKCKKCGKSFMPHNGEYSRCKSCMDEEHSNAEKSQGVE